MGRVTALVRTSWCEWLPYSLPIGGTPLLPARALRAALGTPSQRVKAETCGPTASNNGRELDPGSTLPGGIAVLRPAFGDAALGAVRYSGGGMVAVSDSLGKKVMAR